MPVDRTTLDLFMNGIIEKTQVGEVRRWLMELKLVSRGWSYLLAGPVTEDGLKSVGYGISLKVVQAGAGVDGLEERVGAVFKEMQDSADQMGITVKLEHLNHIQSLRDILD